MSATTATVNPNTNTPAMYYLIHTPHHPRPYLSTVSFIANDFATWGCRVTRHAKNSPYITEVRYQEKKNRPASRRIELMEVWAKEVLSRKRNQNASQVPSTAPSLEARKDRASGFVQDFISTLSTFESPLVAPTSLPNDLLPLPAYPFAMVAKYTRLLHRCAYTTGALLPSWSNPEVFVADQVSLEFRFERSLNNAHLSYALKEAIANGTGRMGKVERCRDTGVTKVLMWVDVGDLVVDECRKDGEVEDPVPVYEKGAWVWPPAYKSVEDEVGLCVSGTVRV